MLTLLGILLAQLIVALITVGIKSEFNVFTTDNSSIPVVTIGSIKQTQENGVTSKLEANVKDLRSGAEVRMTLVPITSSFNEVSIRTITKQLTQELQTLNNSVTIKLETFVGDLRLGVEAVVFWIRTNIDEILDDLEENHLFAFIDQLETSVLHVASLLGKVKEPISVCFPIQSLDVFMTNRFC